MTPDAFRNLYLGQPEPLDAHLMELAHSYYRDTEAYDRTVCTGPITRDGIMPLTSRERGLINRNAGKVMARVRVRAELAGFTGEQLREALKIACNEPVNLETQ